MLSTQIYPGLPALVIGENCISALNLLLLVISTVAVILELLVHNIFKHVGSLSAG